MKCLKWCFIDLYLDLFASPSTLVACANIESFNMKLNQTCSAFRSFPCFRHVSQKNNSIPQSSLTCRPQEGQEKRSMLYFESGS